MFDVLDQLISPLSTHINDLLSQPITGTDDQRAHAETKKAYLTLLNSIMASKLQGIFISERMYLLHSHVRDIDLVLSFLGNSASFENLIQSMQQLAEDVSDPASEKAALTFLNRCVTVWVQSAENVPTGNEEGIESLPGFERFIYERLVPIAFRVPSMPNFNFKDGQMTVVSASARKLSPVILMSFPSRSYMRLPTSSKQSAKAGELNPSTSSSMFSFHHKIGPRRPP